LNQAGALPHDSARLARGYLICLGGTAIWSLTGISIRYITENYSMPPLLLAFWRDLFVTVALAGAFAFLAPALIKVGRANFLFLALYGLALTFLNASWTISVSLNGAAVSTVLVYSSPAITAIVGWRLFGERLDHVMVAAILLSILGCGLVAGAYDPAVWKLNLLGIVTGLLSGLAFAGYSLMGKASALRQINPWSTLMIGFAWATLFLFILNQLPFGRAAGMTTANLWWLGDSLQGWGVLLLLAIGPTIGGYGLYTVSLGYLPSSVANLIATLEPVLTAILAYFLLAERLTVAQIFGSAMIITGVVLLRLQEIGARRLSQA